MILYPSIDIKDSVCVRLNRGDINQATIYHKDPVKQAEFFAHCGCQWLHLVDLDGAVEGRLVNSAAVTRVVGSLKIPVQLGGGIRSLDTIQKWFDLGISRVILATAALRDPDLIKNACEKFADKVVVSIDVKDGHVAFSGWTKVSDIQADDFARRMEDAGVSMVIYTDIARDGTLEGPNIDAISAFAEKLSVPVIACGGVASLDDLKALKALENQGIAGVICGRAFYDGRITPEDALQVLGSA